MLLSPIVGVADTSPTRRTRPFCRYRDISPVSAGESTPKEEAKKYVVLSVSEISHPCLYVILSVSEISHHQSEKNMAIRNPPSREIAAVALLPRKDN